MRYDSAVIRQSHCCVLLWKRSSLQLLASVFEGQNLQAEILRAWFISAKKHRMKYTLSSFGDSLHSADMSCRSLNTLSRGMLQSYSTCADMHEKGSPCDPCKANTPRAYIQPACLSAGSTLNSTVYWKFPAALCVSDLAVNSPERRKGHDLLFACTAFLEKCVLKRSVLKMNTWCDVTKGHRRLSQITDSRAAATCCLHILSYPVSVTSQTWCTSPGRTSLAAGF